MSSKYIYIHLGFPKTASTYLQKRVFINSDEINYLGKPFNTNISKIEKSIFLLSDQEFKEDILQLKFIFLSNLDDKKKNLLSHEGFLRFTRYEKPGGNSIIKIIERINKLLNPEYKIKYFFLIRNHVEMLYSYFNTFNNSLKKYNFNTKIFLETLEKKNINNQFILNNFKFFEILELIRNNLDGNECEIFLYEDLKKDKLNFLKDLSNFFELNTPFTELAGENIILNSTDQKFKRFIINFDFLFSKIFKEKKIFQFRKYLNYLKYIITALKNKKELIKKPFFVSNKKRIKEFYYDDTIKFKMEKKLYEKIKNYDYL